MTPAKQQPEAPLFVVADNQALTQAGLHALVEQAVPGAPVAVARSKDELAALLGNCPAGVVLLDYTLFDFRGIEDFLILRKRFDRIVWLLFSAELSETFMRQVAAEDNVGIVLKDSPGDEIVEALRRAVAGSRYFCSPVAGMLAECGPQAPRPRLTTAETEILRAIALGKSVKEIAATRVSSVHTVVTHKKNLFRKLGVNSTYEATRYALRAGLVEMMEYYI